MRRILETLRQAEIKDSCIHCVSAIIHTIRALICFFVVWYKSSSPISVRVISLPLKIIRLPQRQWINPESMGKSLTRIHWRQKYSRLNISCDKTKLSCGIKMDNSAIHLHIYSRPNVDGFLHIWTSDVEWDTWALESMGRFCTLPYWLK